MAKMLIAMVSLVACLTVASDAKFEGAERNRPAIVRKPLPGKIANPQEKPQAKMPLRGEVVWVDDFRKVIWINLGQADGLKPRTKFQVMQKLDDEVVKGQIEVTRVLAPRIAEARILSEPLEDAISKGDLIVP